MLELDVDEISADDGLSKVITQLDKIYLQDVLLQKYESLDSFASYRRPVDVFVGDFLIEFDKKVHKNKKFGYSHVGWFVSL